MSVETVNGHVLLPFPPQWKAQPEWSRAWQTEIASGILGNESRMGLRAAPRATLAFTVLARDLNRLARLDDAVRAAKKSGLACAPVHGRGCVLAEDTLQDSVTLTRDWNPAFAAYLFLSNSADAYEVREIVSYADNVLQLDDVVARTYAAGTLCWPLIFGRFSAGNLSGRTADHAQIRLTISELTAPASVQLGAVEPDAGVGIEHWAIEDNFQVAGGP